MHIVVIKKSFLRQCQLDGFLIHCLFVEIQPIVSVVLLTLNDYVRDLCDLNGALSSFLDEMKKRSTRQCW